MDPQKWAQGRQEPKIHRSPDRGHKVVDSSDHPSERAVVLSCQISHNTMMSIDLIPFLWSASERSTMADEMSVVFFSCGHGVEYNIPSDPY